MQIKPSIVDFSKILSGEETKYRIPKYQRDYSWKYNEEVEELWNDIMFSFKQKTEYFIGNIVLNANGDIDSATEFDIVDGQQRITTFSILFKVIKDYASFFTKNHGEDEIYDKWNYDRDYDEVFRVEKRVSDRLVYYGEPDNYYLELNEKDNPVFKREIIQTSKILRTEDDLKIISNDSRILKTKKFFASKILELFIKKSDGATELHEFISHLIKKLKINAIKVGEDYDAYLLFESLNSKGMSLSQADLIKNKMLMICQKDESVQKNVFENWSEIISNLKESNNTSIVDFFYYHWLAFENSPITKKTLYKNVRQKLLSMSPKKIEKYSKLLVDTSNSYSSITNVDLQYPSNKYKSRSLEQYLSEIQQLKYSICIPVILYSKYKKVKIIKEITELSVAYLFRTITVGELQVRKAKETFDEVLKYLKSDTKPKLGKVLQIFNENLEIDNTTFKSKFVQKTFSNGLARYALAKILQNNLGSETMIYEVDLEHILPQSYKEHWSDFDFKKRKPEDVINNIGNLTLINPRNNKKVQNYSFDKKIDFFKEKTSGDDGKSTSIPLTFDIHKSYTEASKKKTYKKNEYWDTVKIDKRAIDLSMQIETIWKIK
ncbi:DUF262 domain-containing protein [Olleya sp. 1-3]|uniref:DUF262 domain-containing protein n=1 Tax=Olleya sp. 1-3 TaxID=2058323 RepID=UPI000C343C81|nr:DUF262 domain-containing protein [Olleya sp. 1-3]PKG52925.1 hypothetical protein CXF54_03895 [Olleya sp. 1-3]